MLNVSYIVKGDSELISKLNNFADAFSSLEPFQKMGKQYLKWISANFTDEGATFNESWPPLSPVTLKIKRRLYNKGKSIAIKKPLVRTGALRKSFQFDIKGKRTLVIYSTKDYAELHQKGGKVLFRGKFRTIPRRVLIALDEKHLKKIEKIYSTWIKKLLRKQGLGKQQSKSGWVSL